MTEHSPAKDEFTILKQALQAFQVERLKTTYADQMDNPDYIKLGHFFFEQIYSVQDFGFRNESIKTLHHKLTHILKGEIVDTLGKVIELHDLTDTMDDQMVRMMMDRQIGPDLTMEQYQEIYRNAHNYDQRGHQIESMVECIKRVHHVSRMRWIKWSLKSVNAAAHLAGLGKIMDFLLQGYDAFHSAADITLFVNTIYARETALNNQLFGLD
ncbi:MAG: hypothetical protein HQK58_00070 [Deltaproteobacteria bacterium]|nr:hypothetical protein [Deltaproteobacteria bacterium]